MMTYNVNHELTLINLLGLNLVKLKKANFFNIIDENKKKVGYIEILDGSKTHMEIKTNRLSFSETYCNKGENSFDESEFYYSFTVWNTSGISYNVSMNIGVNPFICVKDQDGTVMASFLVSNSMMHLSLAEDTKYFRYGRMTEIFLDNPDALFDNLGLLHKGKMLVYETTYNSLNNHDQNLKRTKFMAYRNRLVYRENELITEKSVFSGERKISQEKDENSKFTTIADLLGQNQAVKDLINDFRLFLNSAIPFKNDVLLTMLKNRGLPEYPFNILIDELKHPVNLSCYHFVKDISDDIKLGFFSEIKSNLDFDAHCDIIYNDGSIYDFGSVTTNCLNSSNEKGSFGIYQNYLLKYLDDMTLVLAFDMQSRTFISDASQLGLLDLEIKKHINPCKTRIKINKNI